jgi:hypothetical protein
MYLYNKMDGHDAVVAEVTQRPPFGPGIPLAQLATATRLEVWATEVKDPGEYTEFRCFDAEGNQVATGRVDGY